ncbi:HD domain-containing protein [bacterium]|nr:HD domain-containing protein [bacterium]
MNSTQTRIPASPPAASARTRRAGQERFRRITDEAAEMIKLASALIETIGYASGIYRLYTREHRLAISASRDLLQRVRALFINRRMVTIDVGLRRFLVYQLPIYEVGASGGEFHALLRRLEIGGLTFLEGVDLRQVVEFVAALGQMTGRDKRREWLVDALAAANVTGIVIEPPLVDEAPKSGEREEEDEGGGLVQSIRVKIDDRMIPDARRVYAYAAMFVADMMTGTTRPEHINLRDLNRISKNLAEILLKHPNDLTALAVACRQDEYSYRHAVNVAIFGGRVAATVFSEPTQVAEFVRIALLYDLGKGHEGQPLVDRGGELSPEEFEVMKRHPLISADILDRVIELDKLAVVVAFEHHIGGKNGYPPADGNWEINLVTRLVRVAEAFDSLIGNTGHRNPLLPRDAFARLREEYRGTGEAPLLDQLIASLGVYPPGLVVTLSNGEVGVVVRPSGRNPLTPIVAAVSTPDGVLLEMPVRRRTDGDVRLTGVLPIEDVPFNPLDYYPFHIRNTGEESDAGE